MYQKNKYYLAVFFTYLALMHIALPTFNSSRDFFYFSSWRLFSSPAKKFTYDLTWDDGQTYLFRDHLPRLKKSSINTVTLYYLVQRQSIQKLNSFYTDKLKNIFATQKIYRHKIQGSAYQHGVRKEDLLVLHKEPLHH